MRLVCSALSLVLQLGFDGLFVHRFWLRTAQQSSVDEDAGRAHDARSDSILQILLNVRTVFAARETGLKLSFVQLETAGKRQQGAVIKFVGISEQEVVVLPKFSLLASAA